MCGAHILILLSDPNDPPTDVVPSVPAGLTVDVFTFLLSDGGVLTVGQRTGRAVAQPCDVVFIPTEALILRPGQKDERRCYPSSAARSRLKHVFIVLLQDILGL